MLVEQQQSRPARTYCGEEGEEVCTSPEECFAETEVHTLSALLMVCRWWWCGADGVPPMVCR